MQLSIATRHGHLSEASQDKLKSRVEKLSRYFDRLMAIEIIVDLSDEQSPQVDIKVSAEHKHDFVAHAKSDSLLAATDGAVQKLEQQLRKYKGRVQQKHRKSQPSRQEIPVEDEAGEE
ncbi:MAG: ribosome-associated translation inhibitor RaiA [Planctomycetes bacterium]|nr:ribosome-associated translation inhibitor RaiA [Planctomycetota bacterium]